jgi:beta-N-acetylhexosaminidase
LPPPRAFLSLGAFALALVLCFSASLADAAAFEGAPKPEIVWEPVPFGAKRRAEMSAYSRRHYGVAGWRLTDPKLIVEHYTASNTFASAFATFASDAPDSELHELPGVCAHFVIDQDGTTYQLVPLTTRCRHTVGLNYTAIGIEHVGTSDAQVLGNRRQLQASLRLTTWLMDRFGISLGNAIGHNESRESPYHLELSPSWRCQTHGDFRRATMNAYRARLKKLGRRYQLDLSPPRWVDSGC